MDEAAIALPSPIRVNLISGSMGDDPRIQRATKTIAQMQGVFLDEACRQGMDQNKPVYTVECWKAVPDATEGGLFWGSSTLFPGIVGDEYFMTRGHFHARRDRAEYYCTISGTGLLVLMDEQRRASVQAMSPGTTHYTPGRIAHRVVNTGAAPLTFFACWPSDAGYDYSALADEGFSVRVLRRQGCPEVINRS